MIKRGKPPKSDNWSIPGGAQELGETLIEAAHREIMEETGIKIYSPYFLETIDFIDHTDKGDILHHYTLIDYVAEYKSGEIMAGDDARSAKWVSLNNLSEYNLWDETEKVIIKAREALKRRLHDE